MKPNTKKGSKSPLPETPSGDGFKIADDQRRIRDVESARSIYNRFILDSSLRIRTVNEVRAQLEGRSVRSRDAWASPKFTFVCQPAPCASSLL